MKNYSWILIVFPISNWTFHFISYRYKEQSGVREKEKGLLWWFKKDRKENLSTGRCGQFLLLIFVFFFILIHHIKVCCLWHAATHRFSSTFLSRCSRCGSLFILWYSRSFSFSSFKRSYAWWPFRMLSSAHRRLSAVFFCSSSATFFNSRSLAL